MWGSKALSEDPKSPSSGGGLSNAELQKRLKERDSQVELLTQQVAQLMQTTQELQAEVRRNKSTPTLGSRSHHWQPDATRSARVHPRRRVRPRPAVLRWAPPAQRAPSSPGRRAALRPRGAAARRRDYRSARRGLARQRRADLGAPPSMPPCAGARSKRECPRIEPRSCQSVGRPVPASVGPAALRRGTHLLSGRCGRPRVGLALCQAGAAGAADSA